MNSIPDIRWSAATPVLPSARWEPVTRNPSNLRLHPSIAELSLLDVVNAINTAAQQGQSLAEPVAVTVDGIILAGVDIWHKARLDGRKSIECIECCLNEHEAIQFILDHHRPQRGWNAFIRICLALVLEPAFQQKARANLRAGGRYKGSAILPEAEHTDVRREIAAVAGTGVRNVSKVKTILAQSAPAIRQALRNGLLSINMAEQWARLTQRGQVERFAAYDGERSHRKLIREAVGQRTAEMPSPLEVIQILRQKEEDLSGSVEVRPSPFKRTVVLVGNDIVSTATNSQQQSSLT